MNAKTLLLLIPLLCAGHELEDNRATLVLRDRTHVSVTLYVAYPEALHQALAPHRGFTEFAVALSAMRPEDLQKELARVQAKLQAATHLYSGQGAEVALSHWTWPDWKQVQGMLQQRIMQAMVDPAAHAHDAPVEIHADGNAQQEINSVRIQLAAEFRKVLVVAYRPSQVWVESNALSPAIKF